MESSSGLRRPVDRVVFGPGSDQNVRAAAAPWWVADLFSCSNRLTAGY